jgi:signal recognition particle subunit SEC65
MKKTTHTMKLDQMKVKRYGRQVLKDGIIERLKIKNVKSANFNSLSGFYCDYFQQTCYCQHDCCGCWFSVLTDIKRKGDTVEIRIAYARNY